MSDRLQEALDALLGGNAAVRSTVVDLLAMAPFERWLEVARGPFRAAQACAVAAAARRTESETPGVVGPLFVAGNDDLASAFVEMLQEQRPWCLGAADVRRLFESTDNEVRFHACKEAAHHPELAGVLLDLLAADQDTTTTDNAARDSLHGFPLDTVVEQVLARVTADGPRQLLQALQSASDLRPDDLGDVEDPRWDVLKAAVQAQPDSALTRLRRRLGLAPPAPPRPTITGYGTDLTAELAAGRVPETHPDPAQLDLVTGLLTAEEGPRAVVLRGPSGVGKTALVHGVAARLAAEGWTVLRITAPDFLTGTQYLGEWQSRVATLLEQACRPARVLLFLPGIDAVLTIGKSANTVSAVMDQLLPRIENGDLAVLGESRPEEFAEGIGRDPSVAAAFTVVDMRPTDDARTDELTGRLLDESGQDVASDVVVRARELADAFRGTVAQPGRTLGLVRRALELVDEGEPLTPRHVLEAVSESSGMPIDLLDDDIGLDLAAVRRFFSSRVMGQPEAVDHAVDVVTLIKAGVTDPRRPNSVMLFVGPTGVGKTELARALAEYLFGDPERLVRIDLSEYANHDSFQRLIGGFRPGTLTGPVQDEPFSVVLLDELEKAHLNVFDLFLQLFDAGRLTDGTGRTVDFRSTIVIMTSNVGSRIETQTPAGFGRDTPAPPSVDEVERTLQQWFRPEFLNRIDRIVNFAPLSLEVAERITRREIDSVLERSGISRRRLVVDVDAGVVDLLLHEGYSPAFGARPLKRTVEKHLLVPVARAIAARRADVGSIIHIGVDGDRVVVTTVQAPAAGVPEQVDSPDLAALEVGAAEIRDGLLPLQRERAELLRLSNAPDFWERPDRADILDRVRRIDALSERAERLVDDVDRTRANRNERRRATFVAAHGRELRRLRTALDDPQMADAFVTVSAPTAGPTGLDGVAALARMYLGLAERWQYDVEILDDRIQPGSAGNAAVDTVTLLVAGPAAAVLLGGETGLHQLRRTDDGRSGSQREVIRVDVRPVTAGPEAQVTTRKIQAEGRLGHARRAEVTLRRATGGGSVTVWAADAEPTTLDDLGRFLAATLATPGGEGTTIVRRYDLGPQPLVRDTRTGLSTGRLGEVLRGNLDEFLLT